MKLVIALEQRFTRTPDGAVWTGESYARPFWNRYLSVFDGVEIVARVHDCALVEDRWRRVDGDGVAVAALPPYVGPGAFLRHRGELVRVGAAALRPGTAAILRIPGAIGASLAPRLAARGQPFGVEVVGDPYDMLGPGVIRHPLRPVLRHWLTRALRAQCRDAAAALYVTERTLQQRYPCAGYSIGVSDVELAPDALVAAPRDYPTAPRPLRVLFVGAMERLHKGPDVLIRAAAIAAARGLDLRLRMVGDGACRPQMEYLARDLRISDWTEFVGRLPAGAAIRQELDAADLFVLPSHAEGLPRALVEAMARAVPCVASGVGGVPELLPADDLVPRADPEALADRIGDVAASPERLGAMSARNLARAREFRDDLLDAKRLAFLRAVRDETAAWTAPGRGRTA